MTQNYSICNSYGFIKLFIFGALNFNIASMGETFWQEDCPIAFLLKTHLGLEGIQLPNCFVSNLIISYLIL